MDVCPAVTPEAWMQPGLGAPTTIDGLPSVQVVDHHCGRARGPLPVSHHDLLMAVGKRDLELGEGPQFIAVNVPGALPAETPPEPAIAQGEPQHRGWLQQRGDIPAAVTEPPLVT